ncbi:MAG: hypothetical protein ROW48_11855 [Bellilinea sp.]|jgi:hypothetical protein
MNQTRFLAGGIQRYAGWYLAGVISACLFSLFQQGPGFMDAAYYAAGGARIAQGLGETEPYLWNYLSNPSGLPAPSFTYWMPLPAILAAVGMILGQSTDYGWSKLAFVLLAGWLPVLSVFLAKKVLRNPVNAWIAGGLAVFPGIYAVYISTPESFTPYLVGGAFFLASAFFVEWKVLRVFSNIPRFVFLGMVAGWMHLSRADGILWLGFGFLVLFWRARTLASQNRLRVAIAWSLSLVFGYSLWMGVWYWRNLSIFGSLFAPGSNRTLFLTDYNQTFAYPPDIVNMAAWLASGASEILSARLDALLINLQNLLAVQGAVVLLPLTAIGFWIHRREASVRLVLLVSVVTLGLMTVVFPFAGSRGGYLHSASSTQVFFWVMAAAGLDEIVRWGKQARGWNYSLGIRIFGVALIVMHMLIAVWFYSNRVIDGSIARPVWNQSIDLYQRVGQRLQALGFAEEDIGMVNNPPGFYWATGRASIVIPDGDIKYSLAAARRYGADYLLLESAQENLAWLYNNPQSLNGIKYFETFEAVHIFIMTQE